ncbi:MAG: hypothetical protein WBF47_23050 [Xanthobacteraceae bacterium]
MLAAEMFFRSAPEVWPLISAEVVAFAARWHTAGKADRAARFMMTTGRPEFAPQIWRLISTRDDQVYLSALRAPVRFRPKVLGEDTEARLAALPKETRRHVVAEIAANSGFDGMELAVRIARADPSPEVVVEILQDFNSAAPIVWSARYCDAQRAMPFGSALRRGVIRIIGRSRPECAAR